MRFVLISVLNISFRPKWFIRTIRRTLATWSKLNRDYACLRPGPHYCHFLVASSRTGLLKIQSKLMVDRNIATHVKDNKKQLYANVIVSTHKRNESLLVHTDWGDLASTSSFGQRIKIVFHKRIPPIRPLIYPAPPNSHHCYGKPLFHSSYSICASSLDQPDSVPASFTSSPLLYQCHQ